GIDLDDVDECVDRLVRLLVEQEVQAAEIGVRHAAAGARLARVEARREPAEDEEQRDGEQPPGIEGHRAAIRPGRVTGFQPPRRGGIAAASGGSTSGMGAGSPSRDSRRRSSRRRRDSSRRLRKNEGNAASRPTTAPATKKSSRKITSGARQARSSPKRKKRNSVTVVFDSAKPSAT